MGADLALADEDPDADDVGAEALLDVEPPQAAVVRAMPATAARTRERVMAGVCSRCDFACWPFTPECRPSRAVGSVRRQPTSTVIVCQPVAPSGEGEVWTPGCGVPVKSVARTCSVCRPGAASQGR